MNGREDTGAAPSLPDAATVSLSLVIPAYNEGLRLADGMARLFDAVGSGAIVPATTEFVVVDDGSTDDTSSQARALFSRFPHVRLVRLPENRGKGAAVRAGVASATAPIIAFADADMAIDPAQTPQFIHALENADLAIGSRAASGASVNRTSFRRSVMNRSFNKLVNAITRVSLDDTQCGFKAFRAPAAKLLFHCSVIDRFAFDVEILSLARRLGLPIAEVPVRWLRVKGSRIRPLTDARSMARDVFRASRSTASAPPVPALALRWSMESPLPADASLSLRAFCRGLPPGLPVLEQGPDGLLVLCPLMGEPEIAAIAARMGAIGTGVALERRAMAVTQLGALAPLSMAWRHDIAAVAPTASTGAVAEVPDVALDTMDR